MKAAILCLAVACASAQLLPPKKEGPPPIVMPPAVVKGTPRVPCTTVCGLHTVTDKASCVALNAAEARALYFFKEDVKAWPHGWMSCAALDGWKIQIRERDVKKDAPCSAGGWNAAALFDKKPFCVVGMTHSSTKLIELQDEAWAFNALTHELAHVLDEWYGTEVNVTHCGWGERGIARALVDAAGDSYLEEVCE
jgi:hypothetical protein